MRCEQMPNFNAQLKQRLGEEVVNKMFFRNAFDFFTRYEAGA